MGQSPSPHFKCQIIEWQEKAQPMLRNAIDTESPTFWQLSEQWWNTLNAKQPKQQHVPYGNLARLAPPKPCWWQDKCRHHLGGGLSHITMALPKPCKQPAPLVLHNFLPSGRHHKDWQSKMDTYGNNIGKKRKMQQ